MRLDAHGWLKAEPGDTPVIHLPTVRTRVLATGGPLGLVWHATGGVGGPRFAEGLARRIQTFRRGIDRPASWHVLISAVGAIYQSAPFTVGTWHVGRPGLIAGVQCSNINSVTIGVELENAGPLLQIQGAFYAWPYWLDRVRHRPDPRYRIESARVARIGAHAYDAFPPPQIASAYELVVAIARNKGWSADAFRHCHSDFAAPKKTDPGELWKAILPALLDAAFKTAPSSEPADNDITVVTGPPNFEPDDQETPPARSAAGPQVRQAS